VLRATSPRDGRAMQATQEFRRPHAVGVRDTPLSESAQEM
jgi:hypothetical protein